GGDVLVLPGGTMNMLPKALHGDSLPADIIAALGQAERRKIPAVEAGDDRAYVGVIAGPLAAWARPREALRDWHFQRFARGLKVAIGRLASPGIRVVGAGSERLPGRGVVVNIVPTDAGLEIASLTATRLGTLLNLARCWALDKDWTRATDVQVLKVSEAALVSASSIIALMDGEERILASPAALRAGFSQVKFLSTLRR
ncbi:MAG: hypothetical protein ACRC1J_11100, partial [Sandaracinobacteroides sp.]